MLLILWSGSASEANFANSEDHKLVRKMLSGGTQWYREARVSAALSADAVLPDPMRTREGCSAFLTAVPSVRNSGLERTSKGTPGL